MEEEAAARKKKEEEAAVAQQRTETAVALVGLEARQLGQVHSEDSFHTDSVANVLLMCC